MQSPRPRSHCTFTTFFLASLWVCTNILRNPLPVRHCVCSSPHGPERTSCWQFWGVRTRTRTWDVGYSGLMKSCFLVGSTTLVATVSSVFIAKLKAGQATFRSSVTASRRRVFTTFGFADNRGRRWSSHPCSQLMLKTSRTVWPCTRRP